MNEVELLQRTKQFALRVLRLVRSLPRNAAGRTVAQQLADAGTSVGANYRAACKGRSKAEFAAKLGTVEEEAYESDYWMELIMEGQLMDESLVRSLWDQAREIERIMAASRRTVKRRMQSIANRKSQIADG